MFTWVSQHGGGKIESGYLPYLHYLNIGGASENLEDNVNRNIKNRNVVN